ncbi:MAG: sdhC [Bacteriovoracaceae bacterium]|nr:sdhC [Bacteriovoracaceae bacterium]
MIMAFTGLALSLFLLLHVAGNIIILLSHEKFNEYAFNLESMGVLLYIAEAGLIGIFIAHLVIAIKLSLENKAARPQPYYLRASTGRSRRTWGSSHMLLTGIGIFIFIVYHLIQFKFAASPVVEQKGVAMRNLAFTVVHEFKETDELIIYIVALLLITLHIRHGLRSTFETLGIANTKFDPFFRWLSFIYVYGVMGAFMLIPLWIYFKVPA